MAAAGLSGGDFWRRLEQRGIKLEWTDVIRDLDRLQQIEVLIEQKKYLLRTETRGTVAKGIPGLRRRATSNTANLLSENRPGVTDAGVSLRRLTSRNPLTLIKLFQSSVEDGSKSDCERRA